MSASVLARHATVLRTHSKVFGALLDQSWAACEIHPCNFIKSLAKRKYEYPIFDITLKGKMSSSENGREK